MKLLLITPAFPEPDQGVYVGIQRMAEGLAKGLYNNGVDLKVATTFWGKSDLPNRVMTEYGVPVYRVRDSSQRFGRMGRIADMHSYTFGKSIHSYQELIDDIDIVHSLMVHGGARTFGEKFSWVSTHHHVGSMQSPIDLVHYPFHRILKHQNYKYVDKITVPSKAAEQSLMASHWGKLPSLEVIPHGVDTTVFKHHINEFSVNRPIRILTAGPYVQRKRISDLIDAVSILNRKGIPIVVDLVGDGTLLSNIKNKIASEGLDIINVLGYISDEELVEKYSEADLFVMTSIKEGFGQVILEAMASGTPPIVTDNPPMNELVPSNCLIVEPRNPEDLADRIESIIAKGLIPRLAEECRIHVEQRFDWNEVSKSYIRLYRSII